MVTLINMVWSHAAIPNNRSTFIDFCLRLSTVSTIENIYHICNASVNCKSLSGGKFNTSPDLFWRQSICFIFAFLYLHWETKVYVVCESICLSENKISTHMSHQQPKYKVMILCRARQSAILHYSLWETTMMGGELPWKRPTPFINGIYPMKYVKDITLL